MSAETQQKAVWRLIVVGGHTRSVGKTQLVCDIIRTFPKVEWIAGKVTQYGLGVCAQNGENCGCAPSEHVCALDWEQSSSSGTDSARCLQAGAKRSFWLRTKQGHLAEGLQMLREALDGIGQNDATPQALIIESSWLMQFVKPSLYFAVLNPLEADFADSEQLALDRSHALVLRGGIDADTAPSPLWLKLPAQLMKEKPSVMQREGEDLPQPLWALVHRMVEGPPSASI